MQRFTQLQQHRDILTRTMRGIEREGLRIDRDGHLSTLPHPLALGSALTHPHITTDYSEALLELITGTHTTVESLLRELTEIHQFVMQQNRGESIWMQSMPAILPPEKDIPIATYGSSNTGMLKHVYRRGLAERYGKKMQCIAGLHYNFSMPSELWPLLDFKGDTHQEQAIQWLPGLNPQLYPLLMAPDVSVWRFTGRFKVVPGQHATRVANL